MSCLVPVDQDDEIVRVANQPPRRQATSPASAPPILGGQLSAWLPSPVQALVEHRQGDVGQQRREDAPLRRAGESVLGPPLGPEPVGDRLEVGLEDRFQHQFQRCLDDPVGDHGNPQSPHLSRPTRFGDGAFPNRQGPERALFELGTKVIQESGNADPFLDVGGRQAVDAGRVGSPVAGDPVERHEQRCRVVHEVEQIVEPAASIGHRPTVKLGLHLRYPLTRTHGVRIPHGTTIRRCIFRHCSILPFPIPLQPFPMLRALPGSEYYGGSAPPGPFGGRCTYPHRRTGSPSKGS